MKKWLRRIRGAIGMGVSWAVAWGLVVVLLGVSSIFVPGIDLIFEAAGDELLMVMVGPAFAGGLVFSTVLGIAGRRRRFDELSLPQFTAWGAVGGLLLGLLPATVVGIETESVVTTALILIPVSLLSAVSAAGSLMLARLADDRALLDASSEVAEVGLTEGEAQELLGGSG